MNVQVNRVVRIPAVLLLVASPGTARPCVLPHDMADEHPDGEVGDVEVDDGPSSGDEKGDDPMHRAMNSDPESSEAGRTCCSVPELATRLAARLA